MLAGRGALSEGREPADERWGPQVGMGEADPTMTVSSTRSMRRLGPRPGEKRAGLCGKSGVLHGSPRSPLDYSETTRRGSPYLPGHRFSAFCGHRERDSGVVRHPYFLPMPYECSTSIPPGLGS